MGRLQDGDREVRVNLELNDRIPDSLVSAFTIAVLDDLNELISDVASLYDEEKSIVVFKQNNGGDLTISFSPDYSRADSQTVFIRDVFFPFRINTGTVNTNGIGPARDDLNVVRDNCERLFERVFGFDSFREGQFESIARCLAGKDSIVLLPTGAGKSAAYQLASLLRPGICIVVDPIIALIDDQIYGLCCFGIDRVCQITGAQSAVEKEQVLETLSTSEFHFCFVAPERFQDKRFRNALRSLTTHTPISLIAIDEAHCVSEWGHEFRPAYLNIARISREYCSTPNGISPPLMALTGTASRAVLKDVQRELGIDDYEALITPISFDRPELKFEILRCKSNEKQFRLEGLLQALPGKYGYDAGAFYDCRGNDTQAGLIFCPHVNGQFGVVDVSTNISTSINQRVPFFSGRAPKGTNRFLWDQTKRTNADAFRANKVPLMVCTKAFGMGIDKPNIRYTAHYSVPGSIESFYQEAGRAGRDRNDAHCIILYSNDYKERNSRLLDPSVDINEVHEINDSIGWNDNDDVARAMYFHTNAFTGVQADYEHVVELIDAIGDLLQERDFIYPFKEHEDRNVRERAIHRLLTIGVVDDYTVDFSAEQFSVQLTANNTEEIIERLVRYVASYQRGQAGQVRDRIRHHVELPHSDFVKEAAREMIRFVYDVIERSRRRSLSEIVELCEIGVDDSVIRRRLLNYLQPSGFTESIEQLIDDPDGGLLDATTILENIETTIDAGHLRGETARALQSYPDNIGLLLIRGIAESLASETNTKTIRENIAACVKFAREKYDRDFQEVATSIVVAIRHVAPHRQEMTNPIIEGFIAGATDKRLAARLIVRELPPKTIGLAAKQLIQLLNTKVETLLAG